MIDLHSHAMATPAGALARGRGAARVFLLLWAVATLAGALLASACDAVLLERSKGYFTGGFLSIDYLDGPAQTTLFVFLSLLIDAAFIGLVTGVIAWGLARMRLHLHACVFAGTLVATGVLIVSDILTYEIIRYLGDSFDLALMFDLAGGSVEEVLAVVSGHLAGPLLAGLAGMALAAGLVFLVHRRVRALPKTPVSIGVLKLPALLATAGMAALLIASTSSDTLENGLLRKPAGRAFAVVLTKLTDVDRDGFGMVGRASDPDPFNASVFPYAIDVPGNGIDENGVGGDLPSDSPRNTELLAAQTNWRRRPDVVFILLESFRADVVGMRQDGKPVTPAMDAIAARGASVSSAYSHNGYTVQSRHHLFSGRFSANPGATLVDDFKANGYLVGYFSGQDESFGGPQYDVGFSRADVAYDSRSDRARRYSTSTTPGSLAVPFGVVQERVHAFLQSRGSDNRPLFLHVNFHDTHFPYWHDEIQTLTSAARLPRDRIAPDEHAALWATYTNTVANIDRAVGEVLGAVQRARGKEPGIIITADHGQSLFDEGFLGHGYGLNDVQTKIPLIVANLPMQLPEPFGQVDLRLALGAALSTPPDAPAVPTVRRVEHAVVFQYLGDLSRPSQIAFLQNGGRFIYDFRSQRVQVPSGGWLRSGDLPKSEHLRFLRLIHQWELIHLDRPRMR